MACHQFDGKGTITGVECSENLFVILETARTLAQRLIKRRYQGRARHESRQTLAQHRVARQLREFSMELAGKPYPRRKIAALISLALASDRRADRLEPARAMAAANTFDHRGFDNPSHLEHVVHFLHRRTGDKRPAIPFEID